MQPITVNTKVIGNLISNWTNAKSQREFHKLTENLERFHHVYIDKNKNRSNWLIRFRDIRSAIKDQNAKKLFDDLIGPRNIKYIPIEISNHDNYFHVLTCQTPDKIGLNQKSEVIDKATYYDLNVFNSNELNILCLLFRVPKVLSVRPGYKFQNFRIFAPYLREAKQIEFCDLFLFEKAKYFESETSFIFKILDQCKEYSKVRIHCKPSPANISQKNFQKKIKSNFPKIEFEGFIEYNPPKKDVNHDRFIIINGNQISIRFTTSFNNIIKNEDGSF